MRTCLGSWLVLTFLIAWCRCTASRTCLDDQLDAASKAHLAPIVFQGRLVKVSSVDKVAQFRVKRNYKRSENVVLQKNDMVFLKFLNDNSCTGTFSKDDLKRESKYIVFAAPQYTARPGNSGKEDLVAVAKPLRKSRKANKAVRRVLCQGCAKPPSTKTHHAKIKTRRKARISLRCTFGGNPPPKVQWYRNKKLIRENKRIKLRTKGHYSVLIIKRVRQRDGGWYKCRASSVLPPPADSMTEVIVQTKKPKKRPKQTNKSPHWQFKGRPCDVQSYCLNGGKCTMIESLQERVCECADGYIGHRCEHKDTTYTIDKLTRSSSPPSNNGKPRSGSFVSVASRRRKVQRKSQKNAPLDSSDIVATTKVLEGYWGK
ncbi:protein vein-like isoform X1 [Tachypleus tridentatus]|uniref:protein vein-like isoform X1 n=1 Tax=Tachypleus tridentatus TaxID=6853 RepID=UPI003FD1C958